MEKLKLTSIRLSVETLDRAERLSWDSEFYTTSDILRIAIWIGLKFMHSGIISKLLIMMSKEELGKEIVTLEDVLHTAGITREASRDNEV